MSYDILDSINPGKLISLFNQYVCVQPDEEVMKEYSFSCELDSLGYAFMGYRMALDFSLCHQVYYFLIYN